MAKGRNKCGPEGLVRCKASVVLWDVKAAEREAWHIQANAKSGWVSSTHIFLRLVMWIWLTSMEERRKKMLRLSHASDVDDIGYISDCDRNALRTRISNLNWQPVELEAAEGGKISEGDDEDDHTAYHLLCCQTSWHDAWRIIKQHRGTCVYPRVFYSWHMTYQTFENHHIIRFCWQFADVFFLEVPRNQVLPF